MTMTTQTYTPDKGASLAETIESATRIARATGKNIIINMNGVRFSVSADTKLQDAINTYMEVQKKMFETEQKLSQNQK